ncbi:Mg chelatase, subunit ChlI [Xylanimonas cellulosilytica DSM 15894]|uniref:Mg chelatase, subunit ChlI n=1 Tax=Xylanimonas cellulosilytica (strain DSM 15894 / JCM 12276 / CECT 5975 / KCTC 9989 / LMG 20990 / NBRC 107835 / XIL07) TaxID=446471 RepID=D1C018_XYLCX|nr:YifB family Mg chelatase-like AAA ATPase [Xylanimonas cellulosilytica]ACZ30207.1 Mg chelatase, subunit ChlI [Xylanimonas cellulosilytica DSM 15894]
MALGTTAAVALVGLSGHVVEVQAQLAYSVPGFVLVGLPDTALSESRDRVRAAVLSSRIDWPNRKITVNLSPASLPKRGSGFDLAIAVAVLAGSGEIPAAGLDRVVHVGELGLDGRLQPVRGVLPMVAAAVASGFRDVVVPTADVAEASLVPGVRVRGATTLADVVVLHGGTPRSVPDVEPVRPPRVGVEPRAAGDLADVLGQDIPRLALEIAAAGGHHLLFTGPPGAGKTMLASRLPGILPDLTETEAVEVTAVHSVAGTFDPGAGLMTRPPYEDPHHTATAAAVVGGGSGLPRPGAASRAHRGVLFLDEAPEFGQRVLETLRQPLEHGELVIHRAAGAARFPARFQLVLAANPCPCGKAGGKGLGCSCTPMARRRYLGKLSGPLLDRVDLQVHVEAVGKDGMRGAPGESTEVVAARVRAARAATRERLTGTPWTLNAQVPGTWLRERFRGRWAVLRPVDEALDSGLLSLRGADRVLRLAYTVADVGGRGEPTAADVGLALTLRTGRPV